ncbi:hypothetical protein EZS27_006724 [termite gut metagenome]|uniref:DUF4738 domain-containing protein n=1 Tax=termite gut metagenome TaxID=433724 RepID=A0A5J4SHR0_9ZZZZ
MKRRVSHIILVTITVLLAACTANTRKHNDKQVLIYMDNGSPEEQRLEAFQDAQSISLNNIEYNSYITRTPGDSLPRVTDKDGNVYIDNEITLRITRENNIQIFNRTFTKNSFVSFVSSEFLQEAILERIVYNKTSTDGIEYAVSLCYPQTDLYMPIFIIIDSYGNMTLQTEETTEEDEHENTASQT